MKRKVGMMGIVLMLIVVMSATVIPAVSGMFCVGKETWPDPLAAYAVGDEITYIIRLENPSPYNVTADIYDELPNGTKVYICEDCYFPAGYRPHWTYLTTAVMPDWVKPGEETFVNKICCEGCSDNPQIPGGDEIKTMAQYASAVKKTEAPAITPIGFILLIGILAIFMFKKMKI